VPVQYLEAVEAMSIVGDDCLDILEHPEKEITLVKLVF